MDKGVKIRGRIDEKYNEPFDWFIVNEKDGARYDNGEAVYAIK